MPRTDPFERRSEAYDAWFERNRALYDAELEAIRFFIPSSTSRGLEVGVGSGRFAAPLGVGIGVEPSEKMARMAMARGIEVVLGVAEELPFADAEFDFVLMVTTICFVDDASKAFMEARRVLRAGGRIVVGFVDGDSWLGGRYKERRSESDFYGDATFFSVGEVLELMESAGFYRVGVKQTVFPGGKPEAVRDGFGEGAFVVAAGGK